MVRALSGFEDFAAASRPFRASAELEDVEVIGDIPRELNGTFYRVMPDPYYDRTYYKNGTKSVPFDGDGSVSAFRIKDGKASFKQRYVLTERLIAERKAGRGLFGVLRSPMSHHPCVRAMEDGVANTNVIVHAGKLLALNELGAPYELDPNSLETAGHNPFPGQLPVNGPYTAHPKVDPDTGDLVGFGYGLKGPESYDCTVWIIDKNGKKTFERSFDRTMNGLAHDCAITENYVIIMQMPFYSSIKCLEEEEDGHLWVYQEAAPTWFYVVPKDPSTEVRSFQWKTNSQPLHSGASWEENGVIYFDTTLASRNALSFLPTKRAPGATGEQEPTRVDYVKFKIDPNAKSEYLEDPEILVELPCEFPRVDERFLKKKSRYTFLDCFDAKAASKSGSEVLYHGLNCLAKFDYETKKLEVMSPGPDVLVQEPCFSPRHPGAPEGDGFLITMIDNIPQLRNEVIIQDTRDFQNVVARIILPFRIRSGIHGNWVDAERIPKGTLFIKDLPDLYP